MQEDDSKVPGGTSDGRSTKGGAGQRTSAEALQRRAVKSNAEGAPCDGRIPPELRQQILQHFAQFDDSLYDEIDEEKCLELGEFLDLEYWEREAALEQAKRKR